MGALYHSSLSIGCDAAKRDGKVGEAQNAGKRAVLYGHRRGTGIDCHSDAGREGKKCLSVLLLLLDIFFMRLSVASVVFVSGA